LLSVQANVALTGLQAIRWCFLLLLMIVFFLVGQTNPIENGLWLVQAGVWTRPTDFATGSTAGQAYVFNKRQGRCKMEDLVWLCNTPTACC